MGFLFKNPASKSLKTVEQIPGAITPYYQPYINAGNQALGTAGTQYGNLANMGGQVQSNYSQMVTDPDEILKQIGSGYTASPGYQNEVNQGETAITNAQAAGGMAGTNQHGQLAGQEAEQLAMKDYNQYLNNALHLFNTGVSGETGLYKTGLAGERDLAHQGFNASKDLASGIAQSLMAQAQGEYSGQNNQNRHRGGIAGLGVLGGLNVAKKKKIPILGDIL